MPKDVKIAAIDPGKNVLTQICSQDKKGNLRECRITAAAWRRSMKHKSINLLKMILPQEEANLTVEMEAQIFNRFWSSEKRKKQINHKKFVDSMMNQIEQKTGYLEAKKKNQNLKLVFAIGNFASSKLASIHQRGLRPAGLKKLIKELKKKYTIIYVNEVWTTKV